MKKLYYQIWADFMINAKKNPHHKNDWTFYTMLYMSVLTSINLATISMWLGIIGNRTGWYSIPMLRLDLFPGTKLDSLFGFIIEFMIPSVLLHYFLIFYKKKYEKILEKYEGKKGKYVVLYMSLTLAVFVIPVFIEFLLQ